MTMNQTELEAVVAAVVTQRGFRKRKSTWYRTNEDMVALLDLQKSQWGGQYHLNLAIYLRALGENPAPREHQCQIRTRLTTLVAEDRALLETALNLEGTSMSSDDRARVIAEALEQQALPFLDSHCTLPQLRQSLDAGRLEGFFVTSEARDLLGGTPDRFNRGAEAS